MPIIVNLDVMMAKRHMGAGELAETIGITLYCYRRTARPDAEEADYFKQVFAEYDARWPEIFSQRIDEYMQSVQ